MLPAFHGEMHIKDELFFFLRYIILFICKGLYVKSTSINVCKLTYKVGLKTIISLRGKNTKCTITQLHKCEHPFSNWDFGSIQNQPVTSELMINSN